MCLFPRDCTINHNKNGDDIDTYISHRCDINRPRSRQGHKYSQYKKCRIKQHLSNI